MESGSVSAYIVHENWAFTPFMLLTRCLLEKSDAFYLLWDDHDEPGLPRSPDAAIYGRLTAEGLPNINRNPHKGESK